MNSDDILDFLPIKNIRNGIIETKSGNYVEIIEINPINFLLRSTREQEIIIGAFMSWIKTSGDRICFKVVTQHADVNQHINLLRKELIKEQNSKTIRLAQSYMNLVQNVGAKEAVTRKFYALVEYRPKNNLEEFDYQDIVANLKVQKAQIRECLRQCGNTIVEPPSEEQENTYVANILYQFFNKRSSRTETIDSRCLRVVSDAKRAKNLTLKSDISPAIPVGYFFAPRGLDLTHADYFIMDGMYYSILANKQDGFPYEVPMAWTSYIINAGEDIDVDFYFEKQNKGAFLSRISNSILNMGHHIDNSNIADRDYDKTQSKFDSAVQIKTCATEGQEDIYYMVILVTISAPTYKELISRRSNFISNMSGVGYIFQTLVFKQREALLSVIPTLNMDKKIFEHAKQNVTTSTIASTYMFTSFEMCDETGIMIGVNLQNDTLCIVDFFNTKLYMNANFCILGTSGAGKTFSLQLIALRMRMHGIQVFIIAPLKGFEFRKAANRIGGSYIRLCPGSPDCINIMQIRPYDNSTETLINEGEEEIAISYLATKTEQVLTFLHLLIPDMSNEEEQLADEAILRTYHTKGITEDNDSIYTESGDLKEMPIIEDLYNEMKKNPKLERLTILLTRFIYGSAKSFNRQTNVDLNNKYIVIDISLLKGSLQAAGMFVALDYCWDKIKEDRTVKKAIFIDEAWILIGGAGGNIYSAKFVTEIFKTIRGYGGAACAATQDVVDFFSLDNGTYGKGIINNCSVKMLFKMTEQEIDEVQQIFKLSEAETKALLSFDLGCCLFSSNNNKIAINIKPSSEEFDCITTDRTKLSHIASRNKQKLKKEGTY